MVAPTRKDWSTNMGPLSRYVFPALLASALFASAASAEDDTPRRSITVSASGSVTTVPDTARITSGVATEAPVARDAVAKNSEAMKKIIAGLKAGGIDEKDIQTASFHIEPRYTRAREGEASVIDGYRATNQVQVTVRNLDKLGEVLDRLASLGANEMAGLSFDVSQAEKLKDDARKEAVANAQRRAKLYADAAGVDLGEVLKIDESGDSSPRPVFAGRALKSEAVPIERGTETLEATVSVTWALK
jgi:uncharacterized protein